MPETLAAARTLVKEGFEVMVYCSDDPIQAKMLEDIGCVTIIKTSFNDVHIEFLIRNFFRGGGD